MDESLSRIRIHGNPVDFHHSVKETGLRHLQTNLESKEAKTLFDAARIRGEAYFEDRYNRNFSLIYNRGTGTYHLTERHHE